MTKQSKEDAAREYRKAQARVIWAERKLNRAKRAKADAWMDLIDAIQREERR